MCAKRFGPMCPICKIKLEGVGFPLPKKGRGRCPNGGMYEFEIETNETETEVKKDKFGNIMKDERYKLEAIGDDRHDYGMGDRYDGEGKRSSTQKGKNEGEGAYVVPAMGNRHHGETRGKSKNNASLLDRKKK